MRRVEQLDPWHRPGRAEDGHLGKGMLQRSKGPFAAFQQGNFLTDRLKLFGKHKTGFQDYGPPSFVWSRLPLIPEDFAKRAR
jgi:hypothetical protein